MKTCITCGRPLGTGATGNQHGDAQRCLICRVARDMATFHYPASQQGQRLLRTKKATKRSERNAIDITFPED
jgi:hypothetical protein